MFWIDAIYALLAEEAKYKSQQKCLGSMPPDIRTAELARRVEDAKAAETHRKALEIAEAGRARNFWGK